MIKKIITIIATVMFLLLFQSFQKSFGQDFITRAKITFEKKISLKRMYNADGIDGDFMEKIPQYKYSYFNYTFANNVAFYQFDRDSANEFFKSFNGDEDNNKKNKNKQPLKKCIYSNYSNLTKTVGENIFDEPIILTDSMKPIKWRITQETRTIAGYECRKAIGRIYDTVYIVAFYCEQLLIKGGPESIHGLPGMILGMAIPRYYTTWFATKVELANFKEDVITPPTNGKTFTKKELADYVIKKWKNQGWGNIKAEDVENQYGQFRFL